MRAFARSIIETVRHPLLILDERLLAVGANRPFYEAFAVAVEEIEGRLLFEMDGGRWSLPPLHEAIKQVISGRDAVDDVEISREVSGDGRRVFIVNARRVYRDDDPTPMVCLAMEDVTERRRAAAALAAMNAELEDRVAERTRQLETANRSLQSSLQELASANRELEAFCFSVSHDLRAPLRAVDGFSQELMDAYGAKLDEQASHYLRRVRHGVQRMGQLIDDLLNLSRVSRSDMTREPVDLTALATVVVGELRQREPARNVEFTAQPGLTAVGDPRLLRLVLENLLGNAWKFTSKQPRAVIEFGRSEDESTRSTPAFFVRDNGAGFDMAFAGKLFGAFQRLHTERDFPGTGIGLATVQRIIHRHAGKVWAEGAVGRGATFGFTIPAAGTGARA